MDEKNLYREIMQYLRAGESFALATVFDNVGSAPRGNGAKMIVRANGTISGSIGGGRLEAEAIRVALKTLSARQTVILPFDLTGNGAAEEPMICGGTGQTLIDFVDAADENCRAIYEAALGVCDRGEKAWFVTILDKAPDGTALGRQRCLVKQDKALIGKVECDQYILEKLVAGPAKISIHAEILDDQRFLVEPLRPPGTVYIFGAGHVSQRIAPLSLSVGFNAVALDDRPEYANRERFREPIEVMLIDSFKGLPRSPNAARHPCDGSADQ